MASFGANDPQYQISGYRNAQSTNSIPSPSAGRQPTRYSVMGKLADARRAGAPRGGTKASTFPRERSSVRPDGREQSTTSATSMTEGRPFSAVPSRTTGGIAGKTMVRPASEMSKPAFTGAGSEVGTSSSPLRSAQAPLTKFTSPGTEEGQSALAAGNSVMKSSTAASGIRVGPLGKRSGTGARSPRTPAAY